LLLALAYFVLLHDTVQVLFRVDIEMDIDAKKQQSIAEEERVGLEERVGELIIIVFTADLNPKVINIIMLPKAFITRLTSVPDRLVGYSVSVGYSLSLLS